MIKVIIGDDHPLIMDGILSVLKSETDIKVVGLAANGKEVLDLLAKQVVDIVVLDINMPQMDGVETTRRIKEMNKNLEGGKEVKVLILTMYNDANFITEFIKIGAEGYILKNRGKEELIDALKIINDDGHYFGDEVEKTLIESIRQPQPPILPELTKREKEVLYLVCEGDSASEISTKLFIEESTVTTHITNMRAKYKVRNAKELVAFAYKNKLISW